jgi:hypothetical protein
MTRYLWTDAFAVCNALGRGDKDAAERLIHEVHWTLGRHREDDSRTGWISGLSEEEGSRRPTAGGLRIGKPLPERREDQRFDEELEWERDGQYFHYLTKWMHALDQAGHVEEARELARAAHRAFLRDGRMVWKMSIDLSRPLVPSMGHHDPLDGFVTCAQLRLHDEEADFRALVDPEELATPDALGIGGLLVDAYRLQQVVQGADLLIEQLLDAAHTGLVAHLRRRERPEHRLAFRELGLAIGLSAVGKMRAEARSESVGVRAALEQLARHEGVRSEIVGYWAHPAHRTTQLYREHFAINDTMLDTARSPDSFLVLRSRI